MTEPSFRILITGSRTWDNVGLITHVLNHYTLYDNVTLVSGHCPRGADAIAEKLARAYGWQLELHPANWKRHGKAAGFMRNEKMAQLGADVCLAFIRQESPGATHCLRMARTRGIPRRVWRQAT